MILDFELAPASETDLWVGYELATPRLIGDKAYISTHIKELLEQDNRIELITAPRRNQKQQISKQTQRGMNQMRQIVETVWAIDPTISYTKESSPYLLGIIYAKLTAHTLCIYLNQLSKKEDWLQIKQLAFPLP